MKLIIKIMYLSLLIGVFSFDAFSQNLELNTLLTNINQNPTWVQSKEGTSKKIGSITFTFPTGSPFFANKVILQDIQKTKEDKSLSGGEVTYQIKMCTDSFVSILKNIYIDEEGVASGYSTWDESLNYFVFHNEIYKVEYSIDSSTLRSIIQKAESNGLIDKDCLHEDLMPLPHLVFYFNKGKVLIHNPITYPTCWFDLGIGINNKSIKIVPFGMMN